MYIKNKERFVIFITVILLILGSLITWNAMSKKEEAKPATTEVKQDVLQLNNKKEIEKPKTPEVKKEVKQTLSRSFDRVRTYNIKLSRDLQQYTYLMCAKYKVDYELALSVMYVESSFNPNAYNSKSGDSGLCQINKCNHGWLSKKLGITDFFDPKQNIEAGVYMLSVNKNEGYHFNLISYNAGTNNANKLYQQGIYSSKYSRKVMNVYYNLRETGTIKE